VEQHPLLEFFASLDNYSTLQNSVRATHWSTNLRTSNPSKLDTVLRAVAAVCSRFAAVLHTDYVVDALAEQRARLLMVNTPNGWVIAPPAASPKAATSSKTAHSAPLSVKRSQALPHPPAASARPLAADASPAVRLTYAQARLAELVAKQGRQKTAVEVTNVEIAAVEQIIANLGGAPGKDKDEIQ